MGGGGLGLFNGKRMPFSHESSMKVGCSRVIIRIAPAALAPTHPPRRLEANCAKYSIPFSQDAFIDISISVFFSCVSANRKIMTTISPLPEFTREPPSYNSVKRDLDYRNKISTKVWPDKNKFVQAAMRIEQLMEDPVQIYQPANEGLFG